MLNKKALEAATEAVMREDGCGLSNNGAGQHLCYKIRPGEYAQCSCKDYAEAAITAYLSAIAEEGYVIEQGWRPIETAPRDGTSVLLIVPCTSRTGYYQTVGAWADQFGDQAYGDYDDGYGWYDGTVSDWGMQYYDRLKPTNWRPLPDPPAMISKAEQGEG